MSDAQCHFGYAIVLTEIQDLWSRKWSNVGTERGPLMFSLCVPSVPQVALTEAFPEMDPRFHVAKVDGKVQEDSDSVAVSYQLYYGLMKGDMNMPDPFNSVSLAQVRTLLSHNLFCTPLSVTGAGLGLGQPHAGGRRWG